MPLVSDVDRSSALWLRLKAHLEARLQSLRLQNDTVMDEGRRNIQIGRIAEVKGLLALDTEESTATSKEEPNSFFATSRV